MKQAVGIIEILGFGTIVEVADACVKTANVKLEGYERTTGGWGIIKISGDVGAVKAAVSSGSTKAREFGHFIGATVIARPADGLDPMIHHPDGDVRISKKRELKQEQEPEKVFKEPKVLEKKAAFVKNEKKPVSAKTEKKLEPAKTSGRESAKKNSRHNKTEKKENE